MDPQDRIEQQRPRNVGDAWTMLVVNVVIIGLLTGGFAQGPYSSHEQELWYRYGSLSFFLAGVIIPAFAIFTIRRSRLVVAILNAWMLATLLGFTWFAAMSSGGV